MLFCTIGDISSKVLSTTIDMGRTTEMDDGSTYLGSRTERWVESVVGNSYDGSQTTGERQSEYDEDEGVTGRS